jgi:hypothetical protein
MITCPVDCGTVITFGKPWLFIVGIDEIKLIGTTTGCVQVTGIIVGVAIQVDGAGMT